MTKAKTASRSELLEYFDEYIKIIKTSSDVYLDMDTERYKSRSAGKVVSKKRVYSEGAKMFRLIGKIYQNVLLPKLLSTVMEDYWPDLEIGKCEPSAEWFLRIAMGEIPYQRRSASDQDVILKGDEIVDAMLTYYQIGQDIWFKRITENRPENWYRNSQFLYANTKAPAEKTKEGIREPVRNGLYILLAANENGKPLPSRLEIWLEMNPRDLFTTEEGRAERDRQAARLKQGEASL